MTNGARRGWGVSVTPRPLFTPGKDPIPIVQEAGWAPGSVWPGAGNFASTGIPSPNRPARSQSLYRLSYRAHKLLYYNPQNIKFLKLFWYYKYLCSTINVASDTGEIKSKTAMAKPAFNTKAALFVIKLTFNWTKKPVECHIWCIVLYDAEIWTHRKADQK